MVFDQSCLVAEKPAVKDWSQQCTSCSSEYPIDSRLYACPGCGSDVDFTLHRDVNFLGEIDANNDSMWRYRSVLPVSQNYIVSKGEGSTPIAYIGCARKFLGIELYAKMETENPTGTFKDREASFVISRSKEVGENNLVFQSTGNTGIALSHYAGIAGINSYFFVSPFSDYKLKGIEKNDRNKIIVVDGDPKQVKDYASRFAEVHNFPKISPFHERCTSNSTQAYEIYEAMVDGFLPPIDFYVQVVSAGMGPIGFFRGMRQLQQWGQRVKMPRIAAVQSSEFAPMNDALLRDAPTLGREGETPSYPVKNPYEPTLHTTNAPAYYRHVREMLKETNGLFPVVTPDDSERFGGKIRPILKNYGYELAETERAPCISYAGLVDMVANHQIPRGSTVLLMITGKDRKKAELPGPVTYDAFIKPDYDPEDLLKHLEAGEVLRR